MPNLEVNSAASKPYVGLYMISDKYFVWMERPKTVTTYPRWEQTVKMLPPPTIALNMAPWDAFFVSRRVYYILKNKKLYKFTKIPKKDEDVVEIDIKSIVPLTLVPNAGKVDAVFEILANFDESNSDSYIIVVYSVGKKQDMLMTKGNSATRVPITFNWTGLKVTGIGLFDYRKISGTRLGYVSFGKVFKYFEMEIKESATLKIVSPAFDNQVLFGCPQTFCFHATVDAIAMRGDKIFVVRGFWFWEMPTPNTRLNKANAQHLTKIRTQDDRLPFMTSTVECAFNLQNKLFLIRDQKIYIEEMPGNVSRWRPIDLTFTSIADTEWVGGMDACFRSPTSPNNTYLLKGSSNLSKYLKFYTFLLLGEQFWYVTQEDSGDFISIGSSSHISYLKGLPDSVEAAMYYEKDNKVYAFSSSFVYIIEESAFSEGFTTREASVKLAQDLFFGCNNFAYDKNGEYKTLAEVRGKLEAYKPDGAESKLDYLYMYGGIGVTLFVLIIAAIIGTYMLLRAKPASKLGPDTGSQESLDAVPPTPKASGFSVSEELEEMVRQKAQKDQTEQLKNAPLQQKQRKEKGKGLKRAKSLDNKDMKDLKVGKTDSLDIRPKKK
ncbi:hypothetical protein B4U80_13548 [Leptotrombidium deliense]|uniref:Transmembrane protein n=1 Tax=Leptotrombidium deliense TaxID=299467 RepID=A0A443S4U9_9ACAR|nr:hypothetical protein B4U80_13548 [Leptotrombidium deliense]